VENFDGGKHYLLKKVISEQRPWRNFCSVRHCNTVAVFLTEKVCLHLVNLDLAFLTQLIAKGEHTKLCGVDTFYRRKIVWALTDTLKRR